MIVLQQIKVLPGGANFIIKDEGRTELQGFISKDDHSIGFLTAYEADKYNKVYSVFKVLELKAVLGCKVNGHQEIDYIITVR